MRHRLEYAPVWVLVRILGALPRPLARAMGITLGQTVRLLHPRLSRVAMRNLRLAFPEMPETERRRIVRGVFTSLGRLLAEVCRFPRYTAENVSQVAVYDGLENFLEAERRGAIVRSARPKITRAVGLVHRASRLSPTGAAFLALAVAPATDAAMPASA